LILQDIAASVHIGENIPEQTCHTNNSLFARI
jgi:hypothetical protein